MSCSVGDLLRALFLLFVVKKLNPATYCFRISSAGEEENISLFAKRKKNYQITHIAHYFVCNMWTVHNDLFIFFFSVFIHVPSYVHCRTMFANVVSCFANRFLEL